MDFDVVVIGAGVVGLAASRAAALAGWRVLVLDRGAHPGAETSSRNSEVIHAVPALRQADRRYRFE